MKRDRLLDALFLLFPKLGFFKSFLRISKEFKKMKLPIKIFIGSGVTFLVILIFGWIAFPKMLKSKIKGQLALKPGSEMREMYLKVPFPLDFKIYLFNVTNVAEVQNGDTPVLDEIGPYWYDEWKEKVDVMDNEEDDTLEFNMKDTFIFNSKKSGRLTGDEVVTIPHPMIVGMANSVAREKPAMLSLVNKAITAIYRNPTNIFLTAPVRDILFDGVIINCTVTDFAAKAVCSQLKVEATDLKMVSENVYKFSLIGPKNATAGKRFKVYRGIKNIHDLGRVVEYDNQTEMKVWPTRECNKFQGTDSTIFPPFLTRDEGLVSFAADLCRSLAAEFKEVVDYQGIPVNRYYATLGDMSTIPKEKCYCPTPNTCLKKGVIDLTKCAGVPIIASLPHFFEGDESYVHGVRGLHPNSKDHGIHIYFEAMTGSPVAAKKRLQFNMPFAPIDKIALMKTIPKTLVPMFWVEEGLELNSTYTDQLKSAFTMMKVVKVSKWLILTGSLVGLGVAGFLYFKKNGEVAITPVHNVQTNNGHADPPKSAIISMLNGSNFTKNASDDNTTTHGLSGKEFEKY